MKINKFKKVGTNKYKIYFDNDILTVYEDVILKYNLLYKKDIDDDLLHEINKDNFKASIYDTAIKYISIRMRSVKELREYLTKKKFECKNIDEVIDRLLHENILNDSIISRFKEKNIKVFVWGLNDNLNSVKSLENKNDLYLIVNNKL